MLSPVSFQGAQRKRWFRSSVILDEIFNGSYFFIYSFNLVVIDGSSNLVLLEEFKYFVFLLLQ